MTGNLFLVLLNAAWQAVIFFLLGAIGARGLRRASATAQYFLAVTVLIAASLAPWLSMISLPNSESLVHHWAWHSRPATVFGVWMSGGLNGSQRSSAASPGWHIVPLIVAWTYGLFVAIQLGRLMYGWLQVRRMVASSRGCDDLRVLRLVSSLRRDRSSIRTKVLVSDVARVPFTIDLDGRVALVITTRSGHQDPLLTIVKPAVNIRRHRDAGPYLTGAYRRLTTLAIHC